jgi:hypothetical protein
MNPILLALVVNLQAIAAGTAEERNVGLPAGEWELDSAGFTPSTTTALDGSNYGTITVKNGTGGTALGTLSHAATAFTKGTQRMFTLTTAPASNRFTGGAGTETVEVAVSHTGTGGLVDGNVVLLFRKVPD